MRRPLTILSQNSRYTVKRSRSIITALACLTLLVNSGVQAQGFGFKKNKTEILYRWPASIYFPASTFTVNLSSQVPVSPNLLIHLKDALEKAIQARLTGATPTPDNPETVISLDIIDLAAASVWERRTRSEYQAIGTRTITNPDTNLIETVTDYGYVDIPYTAVVAQGVMRVNYGVKYARGGLVLDQDRLSSNYMQEFQGGYAPGHNAIETELAYQIIREISYRLAPRIEAVEVVLPRGGLSPTSELLKSGLWNQAIARLEAMPAFKKPKDEAYRLYSLAVAREATAFTTGDPVAIRERLERVVELYRNATTLYPKEGYFWQNRTRAEWALYLYEMKVLQARKFEECAGKPPGQRCLPLVEEVKRVANPQPILTNDEVVEMVRQGLSEEYVIASIKHARFRGFDLSQAGRASLAQSGVNKRIIREMQRPQRQTNPGLRRNLSLAQTILTIAAIAWPFALKLF
ncbi:MAG TPA: hypothetical protein VJQ56_12385 [Blastocatellia bacterium]|nr:hypothetical protein [Blastocatellia bacterium]